MRCAESFALAAFLSFGLVASTCVPQHCTCDHSAVFCRNSTLSDALLQSIPSNTTSLVFNGIWDKTLNPNYQTDYTALHASSFLNLSHLVHLTLTKAGIKELIEEPFAHVTRLQSLNLSHNSIASLSAEVFSGAHTHLRILDLSHNFLTNLEEPRIFLLPHLKHLNLAHNQLNTSSLNNTFARTHVVETLVLDGSYFPAITDTMFIHLDRLETISLKNCHISRVNIDFQNCLTNLVTMHLEHNEISDIGAIQFSNPSQLRFLYLDHNLMNFIPSRSLDGLHLRTLSLSFNNISAISEDGFLGLQVTEMILAQNQLTSYPGNSLSLFSESLSHLNLAHNNIGNELNVSLFPHLQFLNLSRNALSLIPEDLHHLEDLESLDLSQNQLRSLSERDLHFLLKIHHLDLFGNNWVCDCQLYDFYHNWEKHRNPEDLCNGRNQQNSTARQKESDHSPSVRMTQCIICSQPAALAGHSVATPSIDLQQCVLIDKENLWGLYILCGVILFIIAILLVFMWTRRNAPIPHSSSAASLLSRDRRRSSWIWEILAHRKSTFIQNTAVAGSSQKTTDQVIQTVSGTTALHSNKNLQVVSSEQIIISNPVALSEDLDLHNEATFAPGVFSEQVKSLPFIDTIEENGRTDQPDDAFPSFRTETMV